VYKLTQTQPRRLLGPIILVQLYSSRQQIPLPIPFNPNPRLPPILRLRPKHQPLAPRNPLENLPNLPPPQKLLPAVLSSDNHRRIQPRNKHLFLLPLSLPPKPKPKPRRQQKHPHPAPKNLVPPPLRSPNSSLLPPFLTPFVLLLLSLLFLASHPTKTSRLVLLDLENRARNRLVELQARVAGWMDPA
jgi:hypothetical protein